MLRPIVVPVVLLFFSFHGAAQKACKPTLRGNRGNYVVIKELETDFLKWNDPTSPNRVIVNYDKNGYDSISVSRNGHQITQFLSKADQIISPRLVLTDEKGTLQAIDSFRPPFRFYPSNDYFGTFSGQLYVRWQFYPGGMPSAVLYRDVYNHDSLRIYWSETGIVRRKEMYDSEYVYTPEGILMSKRITVGPMSCASEFYDNGVLRSVSMDTIILNQRVEWKRDYSPGGILQQERFYKNDKPRSTWREYNKEGILVKTIKHPPLVWEDTPPVVEAAMEPEIYTYVDEQADFPGGMRAFEKHVEQELADIFCQSDLLVSGNYFIRFEIDEQGKAVFVAIEGQNAANLEQAVKSYIEQLPKWRSARHCSRPAVQRLVLPVEIRQ